MGFLDRLKNSWELFKLSWQFILKDKSLLAVPILLPFANLLVLITVSIIALWAYSMGLIATEKGWLPIAIICVFFLFLMFLVNTFLGAAHSWMVFEVAKGKDATLGSGLRRAVKNLADILLFATVMTIVHVLTNLLRGKKREGPDIGYQVRNMAASWIETVTGILGKLVLPAMIVTEKTFKESIIDLKRSAKTWPEVLAIEFGINAIFNLAYLIWFLLIFVIIFLSVSTFWTALGWIILLVLGISLIAILQKAVEATYYTLLYLALVEKKHIKFAKDVFYTKF